MKETADPAIELEEAKPLGGGRYQLTFYTGHGTYMRVSATLPQLRVLAESINSTLNRLEGGTPDEA